MAGPAHLGVPQIWSIGSMPRSCAPRIMSSRSVNWYAGSNGFEAFAGRVGATFAQLTDALMIVAWASRARSRFALLSERQRNAASS